MTHRKLGIRLTSFTHPSLLGHGSLGFSIFWVTKSGVRCYQSWETWILKTLSWRSVSFFNCCKWLAHNVEHWKLIELENWIAFSLFQGAPTWLLPSKSRGHVYSGWAPSSFASHIQTVNCKEGLFLVSYVVGQSISQRNVWGTWNICQQPCYLLSPALF